MIKRTKTAKQTELSRYPRTFNDVWSAIPQELKSALTSKQLARVMDAIAKSYEVGHAAGYADAK